MRHLAFPTSLCATLLLAACSAEPPVEPEPVSTVAPTGRHDLSVRILERLSADDMEGRRLSTPGIVKARNYLRGELEAFATDFTLSERPFTRGKIEAVNLLAEYDADPTDTGPVLVLTAHYDHVGTIGDDIFNGADDNASGVAALFAVMEALQESPPQHDVLLVWLDAEEIGLWGAFEFVDTHDFGDRAVVNLNIDMISQNPDGRIRVAGTYHTPALRPIVEGIDLPEGTSLLFGNDRPQDGPNDKTYRSDHYAFHSRGVPWLHLSVGEHRYYHTPSDTLETVPIDQYRDNLDVVVGVVRALDGALPDVAEPPEDEIEEEG